MRADTGDEIAADVHSSGAGYLVVADAMQQAGWSVTVDGKKAKLVPADEAMAAVAVPAGTHRVQFRYRPPHQIAGVILSAIAAIAILLVLALTVRRRRGPKVQGPRDVGDLQPPDLAGVHNKPVVEVRP